MKTLFLLRHAKSDWSHADLPDIDRPLAKRGLNDAPRMGRFLAANARKWLPDTIITSPARRAHETAELLAHTLKFSGQLRVDERLYPGDPGSIFAILRSLPPGVSRPLLVGHNSALELTAAALTQPRGEPANSISIPTCGLICFEANISDWGRLAPGKMKLRWFIIPKLLKKLAL